MISTNSICGRRKSSGISEPCNANGTSFSRAYRPAGRPTLYGAAAGGLAGVRKAVDIFRGEIDLVMGQIGCPSLNELGPDFLWTDDWPKNR
jgi:hypothetical protein